MRPRLAIVDEGIAFAFRQAFLAGYFADRSVPERATWRHALVVGWGIRDAVYTALWTACANWDWAFSHCMRRLAPQNWAERFLFEAGAFALCLASELLDTENGVALRKASRTAYFAGWVADCADGPTRVLSRWREARA